MDVFTEAVKPVWLHQQMPRMLTDEVSTDSDPQEFGGYMSPVTDKEYNLIDPLAGAAAWKVPVPNSQEPDIASPEDILNSYSSQLDANVASFLQKSPTGFDASYAANIASMERETATRWLQKELSELTELMRNREAEMQQLDWQLQAALCAKQLPLQGLQAQTAGIDVQIFNLQSQLNHLMSALRSNQMVNNNAAQLPKVQASDEKFDEDDVFTVMMRNIPNKYTQRMLIDEVNEAGFNGSYDFVYLPIDKDSGANKGYAFLNFVRPSFAYAFKMAFDGKHMAQFKSNKIVTVAPATIQGFQANYEHFSRTRVNYGDPDSRPLFLKKKAGREPKTPKQTFNAPVPVNNNAGGGFCPFCGTRRGINFVFCGGCGTKLA